MKYKWEWHVLFWEDFKAFLLPCATTNSDVPKADCPVSCVLKRRQWRTEPPPNDNGMQREQGINLLLLPEIFGVFYYCSQTWLILSRPGKTTQIQDSYLCLMILKPVLLVPLYRYPHCLWEIKRSVDVTSTRENWLTCCSYPWLGKKVIFFHTCTKKTLWAKVSGR